MPITSTYMNMPIPIVGVDIGPAWAYYYDSCLEIVDSHDHSPGNGAPIVTSGININGDFSFNNFNAISLRAARFTAQGSPLSLPADKNEIYVSGVDLYYNDGNGAQIRMTNAGAISGSPGNISGLAPPASATYNAGTATFTFQSNINIPANMDFGSITIREVTTSPNGVTISSPPSLAANYTLVLPVALPGSGSQALYVDTSGTMSLVNTGTAVGPGSSYTTITAAIAATSAGNQITVLAGTYTENPVLNKNIKIKASGKVILNGTFHFTSGADEALLDGFNFLSTVTVDLGVTKVSVTNFYITTRNNIINNERSSFFQGFEG